LEEDSMTKYLFIYTGGKEDADKKAAEKTMAAWIKWMADLGKAVVDMGAPTRPGKLVDRGGVKNIGANAVMGYSVIQADSLDAAAKLAKDCPQITIAGGEVGIYQILPM
jgi:hypothetical protein